MSQAVWRPNLTKKFQWEVSQIAQKKFSCTMLLSGFKCKLKAPKNVNCTKPMIYNTRKMKILPKYCKQSIFRPFLSKNTKLGRG